MGVGGAAVSEHIDHFEISIDESHIVVKKVNEERFHLSIREDFTDGCSVEMTEREFYRFINLLMSVAWAEKIPSEK